MSLTNVYYLVCLGITINCVLVTNCLQQAIALLCGSGWCGCSWQTKNKALLWLTGAFPRPGGPSEPTYIGVALPFLSFLFYSLLILLLYLLLQTRPNQQYLNTTNDHRGFSTEFLLVDIDNSVSSLRVLSEIRRKSELRFSTCPLPGTVLDWRIDYSLITEL